MGRLKLLHLTFTGTNRDTATVSFGSRVTVIHGPSDTGKSFIVDAINFVLGAKRLKEIPEREGYTRVLLGLELPTGERVTLARSVEGGAISLYRSDIFAEDKSSPDKLLSAKHDSSSTENVSRFLLAQVGLDGMRVRKNNRNETTTLSFRDLIRLCLIGETQMQSAEAPGFSGNSVSKTKETSVLKLILTGEDDSALTEVPSAQERRKLRGAQQEVVERMLSTLESQLEGVADQTELKDQLCRINAAIDKHGAMIGDLTERRSELLLKLSELQSLGVAKRSEYTDATMLYQRFALLQEQYENDLARLDMIAEAGNLLGYFRIGTCVFCGAEPSGQNHNLSCEGTTNNFGISVSSEAEKTRGLLDDLRETIDSLNARIEDLRNSIDEGIREISSLQRDIEELDERITPEKENLRELLSKRSELDGYIGLYRQVKTCEDMIRQIGNEAQPEVAVSIDKLSRAVERTFSEGIRRCLTAWCYPSAASVRFDRKQLDIIDGDQPRSAHGKGVRAILHAAFTIALAQYCVDCQLPHPGFVVLDSPLVTYRPPDQLTENIEGPPEDVVRGFYRDIQDNFDGQILVLENTDPPEALGPSARDIRFTKHIDDGRYGFFSVVDSDNSAMSVDA